MSKICEKCGNMIPDGVDVCPNCGREDDSAIEAVMNDLSKAFANLGAPEPKKPAAKPETPVSDDETILFHLDEVKEAEKKAEKPAEDADSQNLNAAIEAAMKQLDETVPEIPVVEPTVENVAEEIEEPEEIPAEPADDPIIPPIIPPVTEAPKHSEAPKPRKQNSGSGKKPQGQPAKRQANGSKNPQPKKKRPQESQRPKTSSGHPTNAKKKKKKKKKDNSKTLLGIVIGLIVVLVVIVGAAFGMLYKLGFFETMTDDELLGTTTSQVVSEAPSATPEPTPEATEATEASSIEEENTVLPSGSAEDENTPVDASSSIEVKKFKITGAEYITLYSRGETTEVVYVIDPSDAKNSIEWESSDETIATVSDYGVITARRGGTCTVTGTCGDASITVYVTCDFTVPSTVLDMNYEDVTMNHEGQTLELAIDYDLTADQIKNTVWESSDETVATVSDKGVVTAVADGTAVITASIAEYTASCIVRCVNVTGNKGVNSSESEYVINYEDVTLTRKGEYFQLTLKSVVGNEVPAFTWKSSDTKVATVDSKGVVTAVSNGTCKITTSIGDDDFECVVRVNISG